MIRGELWQKAPNEVPACVDCHQPHRVRKIFYEQGISDTQCLSCHADPEARDDAGREGRLALREPGRGPRLDPPEHPLRPVPHRDRSRDEGPALRDDPHQGGLLDLPRRGRRRSTRRARTASSWSAATRTRPCCRDCHGIHGVRSRKDLRSVTFPTNVPALCGQCHREGNKAAVRYKGQDHQVVENYVESIHGQGVAEQRPRDHGEVHRLPHRAPRPAARATRRRASTPTTCRPPAGSATPGSTRCSRRASTRLRSRRATRRFPTCYDCHISHEIARHDTQGFKRRDPRPVREVPQGSDRDVLRDLPRQGVEAGRDRRRRSATTATAPTTSCRRATPRPTSRGRTSWRPARKCHPGSHRRFAGYLTHATHHDRHKYPWLYWSFWFMTTLLVGTLTVFGVHTLLWLPRSWQLMKHRKTIEAAPHGKEFRRFPKLYRQLHIMVIVELPGPRHHRHVPQVLLPALGAVDREPSRRVRIGRLHSPRVRR